MQITDLDTPAVLVDVDITTRNITAYQAECDKHGINLRPHIKTHKLPEFAQQQLEAGAIGITAQKISEAEVMADAGLTDILITFNILGNKTTRLRKLADRVKLTVVADNETTLTGLSEAFAGSNLDVLIEVETGALRCGVMTTDEAQTLAKTTSNLPNLTFQGLMTYPAPGMTDTVQSFMTEAKTKIEATDIPCPIISSGGTPNMWQLDQAPVVTECRIGTYIYNDRSMVERGICGWQDCAMKILATVISTPAPNRAVIDAGSKALTSDLLGLDGFGAVQDMPHLRVAKLSEEHGVILSKDQPTGLTVGDKILVLPNHACVVTNMVGVVTLHKSGEIIQEVPIPARGKIR